MRKEEEEEGKEEAVGKAEEGKTRKGKASKPESNPPNIHKYIRVSRRMGSPMSASSATGYLKNSAIQ